MCVLFVICMSSFTGMVLSDLFLDFLKKHSLKVLFSNQHENILMQFNSQLVRYEYIPTGA